MNWKALIISIIISILVIACIGVFLLFVTWLSREAYGGNFIPAVLTILILLICLLVSIIYDLVKVVLEDHRNHVYRKDKGSDSK